MKRVFGIFFVSVILVIVSIFLASIFSSSSIQEINQVIPERHQELLNKRYLTREDSNELEGYVQLAIDEAIKNRPSPIEIWNSHRIHSASYIWVPWFISVLVIKLRGLKEVVIILAAPAALSLVGLFHIMELLAISSGVLVAVVSVGYIRKREESHA